jgi:hypothetical protein
MTSWEDIINEVTIPGDAAQVGHAQAAWADVFGAILSVIANLDDGLRDLEAGWKGAASQVYRDELGRSVKMLHDVHTNKSDLTNLLGGAAADLNFAINHIPVPGEMFHHVMQAKADFFNNRKLSGLGPDAIYQALEPGVLSTVGGIMDAITPDFISDAMSDLRDWISGQDDVARGYYNTLNSQYGNTFANMPGGDNYSRLQTANITDVTPTGLGGGGGGIPAFDPAGGIDPSSTFDPSTYDPDSSLDDGYPPGDTPYTSTTLSGADPLTGVGGSGLSVGGLGAGGAGAGGAGAGGLGAGGLATAARVGGIGPSVYPPMLGMGGGAGRGGTGGRMSPAMMGGAHGTGTGSEDEHMTWLQEDDDVWGTDTGTSGAVLR